MTASNTEDSRADSADDQEGDCFNPSISRRTEPLSRNPPGTGTSNDFSFRDYNPDRQTRGDPDDWPAEDHPSRTLDVDTPDVPDGADWSQFRYYLCEGCGWPCLNRIDSVAEQAALCWHCLRNGDVELLGGHR